jgi:class 3 adenylate cyclase/tetratricopeptide (TPR) repeat protein
VNPVGKGFCRECGAKLILVCTQCGAEILASDKFCGDCGRRLEFPTECEVEEPALGGERKHVTALFSDLSGYTAMCEKLDPEKVKELMSRIFGDIAQVVTEYEGFVEKFIGDAVVAIFGVPKAHEDDPVRAIRAARKIHDLVEALSPKLEGKIGKPLCMHTGINTGLVVTGEVDPEKGIHGVAGDTVNLAARLSSLAKAGEILVGPDTHRQAVGHFTFEPLEPTTVKGKTEPVQIYKALSSRELPVKIHRLHGLKADLIGRRVQMAELQDAVDNLRKGRGSVIAISGDAGTGKSRLIEEFKATLDLEEIQWREGHSYSYAQNISYFPMIDLLNRTYQIDEGDPPEKAREKVESGVKRLIGRREDVIPYIGSLLSLDYPEIEGMSPDSWKFQMQKAVQTILSALVQRGPTIICLEDIHWADPSSLDLLRFVLSEFTLTAIFLCVYRPPFRLFPSHMNSTMGKSYREIHLHDLSPSEAQDMTESLLKTKTIPTELSRFIQEKAEGNPFYLEEVINSLIETETLISDNGGWRLARTLSESEISPTIHGLISARLDRLERESKRILQEASVIGRIFLYEILKRVTELKDQVDECLTGLERLDLIRAKSLQPDLEYIFKHALTQEVVYSGLLKKEREKVHERVALVMEQLFNERLPEFYETLAFHFTEGRSLHKAIDYLVKSGEKSLERYALDESHKYFKQAFDLLTDKDEKPNEEQEILIDLLNKWADVYYWRGNYSDMIDLFKSHEDLAESLGNKATLGMFYALLGLGLNSRENFREADGYLQKALKIGEETANERVIGYACTWLAFTRAELGFPDEAISFGTRAYETSKNIKTDQTLIVSSLRSMAYTYWLRGEYQKVRNVAEDLLRYGDKQSNIRSIALGYNYMGMSHYASGDFAHAVKSYKRAIEVSVDPMVTHNAKAMLGVSYLSQGNLDDARPIFEDVVRFSDEFGYEFTGTPAQGGLGCVFLAKGDLSRGIRIVEEALAVWHHTNRRFGFAIGSCVVGNIYLKLLQREGPKSLSFLAKNIGFLLRNILSASRKAEYHFTEALEVGREIGGKGVMGQAHLGLGLLHKANGRNEKAKEHILQAIELFKECDAGGYLERAREALSALN